MIKRKATLGMIVRRIFSAFVFMFLFAVLAIGLAEGRDFSWALKNPIETRLTAEMGHPVTVEGRIGFNMGWTEVRVFADNITTDLGDEASALEASIYADRAGVDLGLWPLLRGQIDLRGLLLREARITLPVPDDEAIASEPADRNPEFIFAMLNRLRRITLDNLTLVRLRSNNEPQVAEVDNLTVAPAEGGLRAAFVGEIEGTPYDVDGVIENFQSFLNFQGSPATITASIGRNRVEGQGTVSRLWPFEADLNLSGRAEDVARLSEIMGYNLPGAGEGTLAGYLSISEGQAILNVARFELFDDGTGGEPPAMAVGPVEGSLTINRRGDDQFEVTGNLTVGEVRIDPLFVRGTEEARPALTDVVEVSPGSALPFAARRVPYRNVRRFGGAADLTIGELQYRNAVFHNVRIPLRDADETFRLEAASATYRDRPFSLTLSVDAAARSVSVDFGAHEIEVGMLMEDLGGQSSVHGPTHIAVEGTGSGETVGEILQSFTGQSNIMVERGRLERGGIDFLAADLLRAFFSEGASDSTPLVCLINRIDYVNGVGTSRAFLLDTNLITITGQGRVNFARNNIDFRLSPRPKDPTLLSLAADYKVEGPIMNPTIAADPAGILRGVATTLGSFALTGGAAALLPLLAGNEEEMANPCITALTGEAPPAEGQ